MWEVRTKTVSVVIGALGTIKTGLDQNPQLLPGHPSATKPQIVTLMSTIIIIIIITFPRDVSVIRRVFPVHSLVFISLHKLYVLLQRIQCVIPFRI
jgi:hypothetical protein